jgi:predicted anti-sigma-YlaC factor YlaD
VTDCKLLRKHICDLEEGALAPELRERLEHHLKTCPSCREFASAFSAVWHSADTPDTITAGDDFWLRLQPKLNQIDSKKEATSLLQRFVPILRPAAIGVAALVAIVLGHSFGNIPNTSSQDASGISSLWQEYRLDSFDQFPEGSVADLFFETSSESSSESEAGS